MDVLLAEDTVFMMMEVDDGRAIHFYLSSLFFSLAHYFSHHLCRPRMTLYEHGRYHTGYL